MSDNWIVSQILFGLLMAWGGWWVRGIARDVEEIKAWMNQEKGRLLAEAKHEDRERARGHLREEVK